MRLKLHLVYNSQMHTNAVGLMAQQVSSMWSKGDWSCCQSHASSSCLHGALPTSSHRRQNLSALYALERSLPQAICSQDSRIARF